jgi:two-component system alkaline phosphatase synthesis response regulator PhoP
MIYLLEDDDSIRKLVVYALESQGYEAKGFSRPGEFRAAPKETVPRLALLDIMLPEEDGLSVLSSLRADPRTKDLPVIMLTAKNTEYDRAYGLDLGADDYISKPFGMMELMARIRAVLRRSAPAASGTEFRLGPLRILPEKRQVLVSGQPAALTYKEYELLTVLAEAGGRVLTRDTLMNRVWGIGAERENRTLDVHIRTLRSKLGDAGALVETVRGVGYRLKEDNE